MLQQPGRLYQAGCSGRVGVGPFAERTAVGPPFQRLWCTCMPLRVAKHRAWDIEGGGRPYFLATLRTRICRSGRCRPAVISSRSEKTSSCWPCRRPPHGGAFRSASPRLGHGQSKHFHSDVLERVVGANGK